MIRAEKSYRDGDDYIVCEADRQKYLDDGFALLEGVLTPEEVDALSVHYDRYLNNEIKGMGKDFCDMSGSYDDEFKNFALVNAMLPRVYTPEIQGNIFEKLSESISKQLFGEDMTLDYDQFLTKKPAKEKAAFAWHQDIGYWPINTPDTRTVTCSLAMSDANEENGCLRLVPGSHKGEVLRQHRRSGENREESHVLTVELHDDEEVVHLPVKKGSITVHNEWILHGSGGNTSNNWRKTYIIAYRSKATVDYERSIGFTHSHNDKVNWDTMLG
jgi:hypothetical protein